MKATQNCTTTEEKKRCQPLIDIRVIMEERTGNERQAIELIDWYVIENSPTHIELGLVYNDPVEVSSSIDGPDKLLIQVELSEFKTKKDGLKLTPSVLLSKEIPQQIASLNEAAVISAVGETTKWVTNSSGLAQIFFNACIGLSLNSLFSLLNGQQIIVLLPLNSGQSYPPNAAKMNAYISQIVSFQLLPEDAINAILFEELEDYAEEPFNENFEQAGFGSKLIILNATSIILQVFFLLALVILTVIFSCCDRVKSMKKLYSALIWNSLIRLFMETYLELLLTSSLNMKFGRVEPELDSTHYAMVLSKVIFTVLMFFPPVICMLWWRRRENWNSEDFKAKYGSLLQGVALDSKSLGMKSMLAVPIFFFIRRLLLTGAIILFNDYAQAQLMLMFSLSMIYLSFLLRTMPLASRRANQLEIFNEITMLMLLYILLLFTQFVPSAAARYNCGYAYMFVNGANILTHLIIMVVLSI